MRSGDVKSATFAESHFVVYGGRDSTMLIPRASSLNVRVGRRDAACCTMTLSDAGRRGLERGGWAKGGRTDDLSAGGSGHGIARFVFDSRASRHNCIRLEAWGCLRREGICLIRIGGGPEGTGTQGPM